jgi:hypothetical protein
MWRHSRATYICEEHPPVIQTNVSHVVPHVESGDDHGGQERDRHPKGCIERCGAVNVRRERHGHGGSTRHVKMPIRCVDLKERRKDRRVRRLEYESRPKRLEERNAVVLDCLTAAEQHVSVHLDHLVSQRRAHSSGMTLLGSVSS